MSIVGKDVDTTIKLSLTAADSNVQGKNFQSFDRVPLLNEIPDQGFVLATVSGTVYLYARIGIKRYKVAMTLV